MERWRDVEGCWRDEDGGEIVGLDCCLRLLCRGSVIDSGVQCTVFVLASSVCAVSSGCCVE